MTHFDKLRSKALENYGIVTSATAAEQGLRTNEVVRFCKDGRLIRVGYGVYRLSDYTPTKLTRYAHAVAVVGEGSYVYGRSVLVLCDLLPYEPGKICIATAQRVRRALPDWIELKKSYAKKCVEYGGIPSQSLPNALEACMGQLTQAEMQVIEHACSTVEFLANAQRQAVLDCLGMRIVDEESSN